MVKKVKKKLGSIFYGGPSDQSSVGSYCELHTVGHFGYLIFVKFQTQDMY